MYGFYFILEGYQQAKTLGSPIDFSASANAAQQCALLEDDLIFNGSKEFDIQGIMNVKGKLSHILSDWMESGNAFTDVVEARNKLLKMGHTGPYALVLSPELYAPNMVSIKEHMCWKLSIFGN